MLYVTTDIKATIRTNSECPELMEQNYKFVGEINETVKLEKKKEVPTLNT